MTTLLSHLTRHAPARQVLVEAVVFSFPRGVRRRFVGAQDVHRMTKNLQNFFLRRRIQAD